MALGQGADGPVLRDLGLKIGCDRVFDHLIFQSNTQGPDQV